MEGIAATRADMVDFSGVFDSWTAWLSTQLHAHASQHASFVSESTEEVTALRNKQQELTLAHQQNSKELEAQSRAAASLLAELATIQQQADALPTAINALTEQKQQSAQRAESGHKQLAEMERRCESELSAIQQHIAPLRRALGLSFVPKPNELQLVFTSISRSQPSRPYLLSVYIDQHNDYAVQQCEPAIQGLTELLADVNRTVITAAGKEEMGDFGLFVMRVRQAFQLLAQAEDERTAANGSTVAH